MPEEVELTVEKLIELGYDVRGICRTRIMPAWLRRDLPARGKPEEKKKIIDKYKKLVEEREKKIIEIKMKEEEARSLGKLDEALHYARARGGHIIYLRYCLIPYLEFWEDEFKEETKIEYIGKDTETGFPIYYDGVKKIYFRESPEGVREYSPEIEVDETVSIITGEGHDVPFVAEITARTKVRAFDRRALKAVQDKIQMQLDEFFKHKIEKRYNVITREVEDVKYPDLFKNIKSRAMKLGVEYRLIPLKESEKYPNAHVLVEKVECDYPRKYPGGAKSYLVDLEKNELKAVTDVKVEHVKKGEEEVEEVERKKKTLEEVL